MQTVITTFHVPTEAHNSFKLNCIKSGSDMSKEINKFIKRFNDGKEHPDQKLKSLAERLIKYAKAADLDVSEYEHELMTLI